MSRAATIEAVLRCYEFRNLTARRITKIAEEIDAALPAPPAQDDAVVQAREAFVEDVLEAHRTISEHAVFGLAVRSAALRYFAADGDEAERQSALLKAEQPQAGAGAVREACIRAVCPFCARGVPLATDDERLAHRETRGDYVLNAPTGDVHIANGRAYKCGAEAIRALDLTALQPEPKGAVGEARDRVLDAVKTWREDPEATGGFCDSYCALINRWDEYQEALKAERGESHE